MASGWTMRVCDYAGVVEGEIRNASSRTFTFGLNQMSTGAFTIPIDDPRAATLLQGDCLVQVFQDKTLRFNAEVISCEEVADGTGKPSLAVTIADAAWWRLSHRLYAKTADGQTHGTALAPVSKTSICQTMLLNVNTEGDTGVRDGAYPAVSTTFVGPWRFKPVIEALLELSRQLDAFDFKFTHHHPTADIIGPFAVPGIAIAQLDTAAVLGTTRPNTIFEYATGKRNIKSYKRQVSRAGLLTRAYSLPPGFPESTDPVVTALAITAANTRGIHEATIPSDLTEGVARAELMREHLAVRKQARQLITFVPTSYGPKFNTDYGVGDVVTARAKAGGSIRFNANFRVYGVQVELDTEGLASYELTLVNDT